MKEIIDLFSAQRAVGFTPALVDTLSLQGVSAANWGGREPVPYLTRQEIEAEEDDDSNEDNNASYDLNTRALPVGLSAGYLFTVLPLLKLFHQVWKDTRPFVERNMQGPEHVAAMVAMVEFIFSNPLVVDHKVAQAVEKDFRAYLDTHSLIAKEERKQLDVFVRIKNDYANGVLLDDWKNYAKEGRGIVDFLDDIFPRNIAIYQHLQDYLPKPSFLKNISWFTENMNFSESQIRALDYALTLYMGPHFSQKNIFEQFEQIYNFKIDHFCETLDQSFQLPHQTFISLFKVGSGLLHKWGIISSHRQFSSAKPFSSAFPKKFLQDFLPHYSEKISFIQAISSHFLEVVDTKTDLEAMDFSHMAKDAKNLVIALSQTTSRKILITGRVGCGKTSLLKYALTQARRQGISCLQTEMDDYTISALRDVAGSLGNPVIVIENAELIDSTQIGSIIKGAGKTTEIWTASDQSIFSSTAMGSFDMVLDIPVFPFEKRKALSMKLFTDPVAQDKVAKICSTPGEIKKLAEWSALSGQTQWEDLSVVANNILQANIKAKTDINGKHLPLSLYQPSQTQHGFSEVVGCDALVVEAKKIIAGYHHPEVFRKLGAKPPRGVLLTGEPGLGKTHLVKAMAHEAGVPLLIATSAALAGDTNMISAVFAEARRQAPCILFLDEIDALGSKSKKPDGSPADPERQAILNRLLTEIDGFEGLTDVMVIGATHRGDVLDEALIRSGRLGRHIAFKAPNQKSRVALWKYYAQGKPLADIDWERVGRLSTGMTPADIHEAMDQASLNAAFDGATHITQKHIVGALDHLVWGDLDEKNVLEDELYRTSLHEAGHAVVSYMMEKPLERASVRPRAHNLGFVQSMIDENKIHLTEKDAEKEICILFAGSVAEDVILGDRSQGSASDLGKIRDLIQTLVREEGQGAWKAGLDLHTSAQTLREVEKFEQDIAQKHFEHTKKIVTEQSGVIKNLADQLVREREMDDKELAQFFEKSFKKSIKVK